MEICFNVKKERIGKKSAVQAFHKINKRLENDIHAGRKASEAHKSHWREKAAILWLLCPVRDGEPWVG